MLSLLWLLFATLAALIAARLVGRSNFWCSEAPALSEVLGAWFILTLVMVGSLIWTKARYWSG